MATGKFHINEQGEVRPCSASQKNCRFGGEDLHFSDAEEARKFVEKFLEKENGKFVLFGSKTSKEDLDKLAEKFAQLPPLERKEAPQLPKSKYAPTEEQLKNEGFLEIELNELDQDSWLMIVRELNADGLSKSAIKHSFKTWQGDIALIYEDNFGAGFCKKIRHSDIPLTGKNIEAWNMSFHPAGPMINFSCPDCGRGNRIRYGNLGRATNKTKYPVARCTCGQLVKIPLLAS